METKMEAKIFEVLARDSRPSRAVSAEVFTDTLLTYKMQMWQRLVEDSAALGIDRDGAF
ncbi:hypothetical protein T484DRAFT_1814372 [Baffinella frigidus]|nr:hypothetical protein T484DRAFT_1814372 [Cryptophyta sp. CCMP2293]